MKKTILLLILAIASAAWAQTPSVVVGGVPDQVVLGGGAAVNSTASISGLGTVFCAFSAVGNCIFQAGGSGGGIIARNSAGTNRLAMTPGTSTTGDSFFGITPATGTGGYYYTGAVNGSGGTIATGTPVKMSGTGDQVTTTAITDTTNILGINETSCTNGSTCKIAIANGIIVDGQVDTTASCNSAIGSFVINSTTNADKLACTSTFTAGTVIGYQMNLQAANGTALHVLLAPR